MRPLARLLALAVAATLLPGVPATAEPAPSSGGLAAQVRELQADVDRAGREMETGAVAYERAAQRLAVLTQQQFAVAADLDRQRLDGTRTRSGVDALVRSAYKGRSLPPVLTALLSGDPRTLSDLARVQQTVGRVDSARRDDLAGLVSARERSAALLQRRAVLRRQALAQEQALDRQRERVAASADLLARRLAATAASLDTALAREAEQARQAEQSERARQAALTAAAAARAQSLAQAQQAATYDPAALPLVPLAPGAVGALPLPATVTGGCAPAAPHGYANGFLPDAVLCTLPGRPGHRLRTDAARAFAALDAARTTAGLPPLCVTDSYRDYAGQVSVFARKPGLAAVPGRSQHGWGLALDLCGGAERFDGEAHLWLRAHAPAYGWVHPAWAGPGGSKPEAWHWEYPGW